MWLSILFVLLGVGVVGLALKVQIPSRLGATDCERGLLLPRYVTRPLETAYEANANSSEPVAVVEEPHPRRVEELNSVVGEARAQRLLADSGKSTHRRPLGTFL